MSASLVFFCCHLSFCELPLFLSHCSAAAVFILPMPRCAVKQPARPCSLPAQYSQGFTDLENLCVVNSLFHCYGRLQKMWRDRSLEKILWIIVWLPNSAHELDYYYACKNLLTSQFLLVLSVASRYLMLHKKVTWNVMKLFYEITFKCHLFETA